MNKDTRPFVSFCIKCYNQEQLIEEALRGAFEQTYPNMEIIISDDCSTDRSVEVIKKKVAEYKENGGKFPVTIIENDHNLGNGGNWQKLCSVAQGEWFVKADGDDRSLPTRVEELMKCWIDGGRRATALGSDAFLIDMDSRSLGPVRRVVLRTNRPAGCVAAYHRSTYDKFGEFSVPSASDDCVYGPRAEYLGPVEYVDKPLVLYRVGAGTCRAVTNFRATRVKMFKITKLWLEQCYHDLEYIKPNITKEQYFSKKAYFDKFSSDVDYNILYWGGRRQERAKLVSFRPLRSMLSANGLFKIALILPDRICDAVLDMISHMHNTRLLLKYGESFKGPGIDGFAIARIINCQK